MVVTPVASATPNPKISPTPLLPTTTPVTGSGKICVLLYDDVNGNAVHDDSEGSLAGGAVSITDRLNRMAPKTLNTTDSDTPSCEDVPEGEYNISMAIPSGYNPTTVMNIAQLKVQAGDQAILEFGAQVSSKVEAPGPQQPQPTESNSNLLLAIMGGVFVLLGIGLGGYILFTRR